MSITRGPSADELTAADDRFHPPDRAELWWTETSWYTAIDAANGLTLWVYPLFRPVMGTCSLQVVVWDPSTTVTWEMPYWSFEWHLPMPAELTDLRLHHLRHKCLEPLRRYRVGYDDGDRLTADLVFEGYREPWLLKREGGTGHFSQPCRVTGTLRVAGRRVELDAVGLRDRSWGRRHGNKTVGDGAFVWGVGSGGEQFLANTGTPTMTARGSRPGDPLRPWGYVIRDGVRAELVRAERTSVSWATAGHPEQVGIALQDTEGRTLDLTGRIRSACPLNWNPNAFAWITHVDWTGADGTGYVGQHQGAMPTLSAALR